MKMTMMMMMKRDPVESVITCVQDEASALWIAAQMGHSQVAKDVVIITISDEDDDDDDSGDDERDPVESVVTCVQDEASALWIAAQMGHSQVAKELLVAGAEVDAIREVGWGSSVCLLSRAQLAWVETGWLVCVSSFRGTVSSGEVRLAAPGVFCLGTVSLE